MRTHILRAAGILVTLILAATLLPGQKSQAPPATSPSQQTQAQDDAKRGERLFQVHCGRCHHPPEQISPRITGTVLRHMRVKATLTPEDESRLMKYLAP